MFNPEMMQKLQSLKQQAEESKNKLSQTVITEEAGGRLVEITMNGNRELQSLKINADLATMDKEDLEDLVSVALKRVLDKVNAINEQEVMSSAQSLFPGM